MKFIASLSATALLPLSRDVYYTLPDTALKQGGQPFFIPDKGHPCAIVACLAVRVCRQGRAIGERFAHRYYDGVACATHFVLQGLLSSCRREGLPWDEAVGFDGAVCLGRFVPVDEHLAAFSTEIKIQTQNDNVKTLRTSVHKDTLHRFIADASTHFTFHQGDVLLLASDVFAKSVDVEQDSHVCGTLNNDTLLSFNIK